MGYGDKETAEKRREPHPDWRRNVNELERIMKATWMPECQYEIEAKDGESFGNWKISDSHTQSLFNPALMKRENVTQITEYKNVTFVWGKRNRFKFSRPISFHIKQSDSEDEFGFSSQLADTLNRIRKDLA